MKEIRVTVFYICDISKRNKKLHVLELIDQNKILINLESVII